MKRARPRWISRSTPESSAKRRDGKKRKRRRSGERVWYGVGIVMRSDDIYRHVISLFWSVSVTSTDRTAMPHGCWHLNVVPRHLESTGTKTIYLNPYQTSELGPQLPTLPQLTHPHQVISYSSVLVGNQELPYSNTARICQPNRRPDRAPRHGKQDRIATFAPDRSAIP